MALLASLASSQGPLLAGRARQDPAPFARFTAVRLTGPSGGFPARRTLPSRAGIAQLAEQLTRNEQARGSSPLPGSSPMSGFHGRPAVTPGRCYGSRPPPPLSRMHVPSSPIVQGGPGVVIGGGEVVGIGAGVIRPPRITADEAEAEGAYVEVSELCQQSAPVAPE
jgi:hypothetical protein